VIKQEATKCTIYGMIVLQKKVRTEYALEIGPEIYRSVHPTIHKKFEKIKFGNFLCIVKAVLTTTSKQQPLANKYQTNSQLGR
jgi:hypothetical protein